MVRRRTAPRKKRAAYAKLDSAAPARRGGALVILVLGGLVLLNLYVFVWDKTSGVSAIKQQALAGSAAPAMTIPSPPLAAAPAPAQLNAVTGVVAKSDTLGKLLKRSGLSGSEADEVIRALSGVLDFKAIKTGAPYRIERGPDGRVTRFELDLSKNHHVQAVRDATGAMTGST
jgi:hypothetical protein